MEGDEMSDRKSIDIDGFVHKNPIPNASRIGNIVMSGVIYGKDSRTDTIPETMAGQCALVFEHMKSVVEAAGGGVEDILKVNIYLKDPSDRAAVNDEWVKMFPDEQARPARHSHGGCNPPYLVGCDFTAVLD
jgi:2-iminobutanoate/2-iminopropanoate deaminase